MTTALHHRLTPTQQESINKHLAFKAKIAANARPDHGITCASVSVRVPPEEPKKPDLSEWIERQKKIVVPITSPWFSIIAEMGPPPPITVTQIINAVAAECELTRNDILSERRLGPIVRARQVAMYLAKELTGFSFPALGRRFGYRDHTTVLHGVRKIERLYRADIEVIALVERVKNKIKDEHNGRYLHHASPAAAPSAANADQAPADAVTG